VVLGKLDRNYLRHDGAGCCASRRRERLPVLVVPTLLTWPGSLDRS
jgi:type IV secretion system protein VirD4